VTQHTETVACSPGLGMGVVDHHDNLPIP